MGKKIIVLNGSPRRGGNTAALVDRFLQGAKEAGHQVTRFDLRDMEIHPCLGCYGGGKDLNSPCVQKDAMDEIYPVYREADTQYYCCGEEMYPQFLEDLKAAKSYIFLEYFIAEPGKMLDAIVEILAQKVKEGVDVRWNRMYPDTAE